MVVYRRFAALLNNLAEMEKFIYCIWAFSLCVVFVKVTNWTLVPYRKRSKNFSKNEMTYAWWRCWPILASAVLFLLSSFAILFLIFVSFIFFNSSNAIGLFLDMLCSKQKRKRKKTTKQISRMKPSKMTRLSGFNSNDLHQDSSISGTKTKQWTL